MRVSTLGSSGFLPTFGNGVLATEWPHNNQDGGLEDDIVSRRSLPGARGRRCRRAGGRPVVLSERERGEVDFMRKLKEAV